jgi:hypothetical protein
MIKIRFNFSDISKQIELKEKLKKFLEEQGAGGADADVEVIEVLTSNGVLR